MIVTDNSNELRKLLEEVRPGQQSVGFVPTMGALHQGHASLIQRSVAENSYTVVSIFVNPTQFGPNEDLDQYPRPLEDDLELCRSLGADLVFTPTEADIYPQGKANYQVLLGLRSMDQVLCGAKRPGHFNGVLQVVTILWHLVQPDKSYFGEKDFQQLSILKTLQRELFFPLQVIGCPIIRESDGLAMSSRNRYLSPDERQQALFLSTCLQAMAGKAREGTATAELLQEVEARLADYPAIRLDYAEVRSARDLSLLSRIDATQEPRAFIAAFCGKTRLIDNMALV